jgi:hypothetical protein
VTAARSAAAIFFGFRIEVYHRVMHAPMEFRGRGCGSILIWSGVARRE